MQEDEQWLTEQTIQWVENHTNLERGVYTFSRRSFRCIHIALQRRVIKLLLTYLYNGKPIWDFGKLESLRAAIVSEAQQFRQFDIGQNVQAVVQYDEVMFGVEGRQQLGCRKTDSRRATGDYNSFRCRLESVEALHIGLEKCHAGNSTVLSWMKSWASTGM